MRILDFFVFYLMANFRRQNSDQSVCKSQLSQAVFAASFNVSLTLATVVEIIYFFYFKISIADTPNFFLKVAIGGILNYALFWYIYITRKRYEHIISSQYKPFNLNIILGAVITFSVFIIGDAGLVVSALVIDKMLVK